MAQEELVISLYVCGFPVTEEITMALPTFEVYMCNVG